MGERAIQAGDLVMVVRGHECLMTRLAGAVFVVQEIIPPLHGGYRCVACGTHSLAPHENAAVRRKGSCIPLSWLKRIDRLPELSSIDIVTELDSERTRERTEA